MQPENITEDKEVMMNPIVPNNSTAPLQPSQPEPIAVQPDQPNKPGIIVLQWLTYAFWGWTIVALGALLATTASYMITGFNTGGFTPYGIAAVIVLLPISAICDLFYSKYEPIKKTGAASIVMVIHAVIFALFGIGSLIAVVFSVISAITSGSFSEQITVAIITALSLFVVYGVTFIRTLRPAKLVWLNRAYLIFMIAVSSIVIILAIVGPVNNERVTKNDRLISSNLSTLKGDIESYARKQSALPSSLSDLDSTNPNVKKIISEELVTYTPNTRQKESKFKSNSLSRSTKYDSGYVFFYELCATYLKEDGSGTPGYETNYQLDGDDNYDTYLSTYNHPAGKVCYKLKTGYTSEF